MLHQANNLFFGHHPDGSVRILKLNVAPESWPRMGWIFPENTILDVTVPRDQWEAIVATLSSMSDLAYQKYNDTDFHKGSYERLRLHGSGG